MSGLVSGRAEHPLDYLDGWRGIAAMMVVFHHCSAAGLLRFGEIDLRGIGGHGVAMFFVLSAFLLSRNIALGGKSVFDAVFLQSFFVRRFMRIFPLYVLYLLLALASSVVLLQATGAERGLPFFLTVPDFIEHLLMNKGFGVTWTIAVEFKFYLLLPFLTALLIWLAAVHVAIVPALVATALAAFFALELNRYAVATETSVWPFLGIFVLGTGLGVTVSTLDQDRARRALGGSVPQGLLVLLWAAAILLLIASMPLAATLSSFGVVQVLPNVYYNTAALFAVIIVATLYGPAFLRVPFEGTFMRYLGAISFSVYLVHTLFMSVTKKLVPAALADFGWIVVVALTIVASHLSYRWIERPTMGLRPRRFLFSG